MSVVGLTWAEVWKQIKTSVASFLLLAVFTMRLIKWPVSFGKTTDFYLYSFSVSHSAATVQLLSSLTAEEAGKDVFVPKFIFDKLKQISAYSMLHLIWKSQGKKR